MFLDDLFSDKLKKIAETYENKVEIGIINNAISRLEKINDRFEAIPRK